jgi:hypothetical protein
VGRVVLVALVALIFSSLKRLVKAVSWAGHDVLHDPVNPSADGVIFAPMRSIMDAPIGSEANGRYCD